MSKAVAVHKLTDPDAPLAASARVILVRLGEVAEYAPAVSDPTNVAELHDMRIAAKRLRYTLEVFAPVLPSEAFQQASKQVAELQERLGAIHDCDVLSLLLEQTLAREGERERKRALKKKPEMPPFFAAEGLVPQMARCRTERTRLHGEFITWWEGLPPERFWSSIAALVPSG